MLSKREKQILKLLFENKHTYLTSNDCAFKIAISTRTVRKYIRLLSETLEKANVGQIIAKPGNGYRLVITDDKKFEKFYLNAENINEAFERQYYILTQLFLEQKDLYVNSLAEELFVSRSTISNDLAEVKKLLSPYQIQLKSKSNKGIYIVSCEKNIRHFIMKYFFMDRWHDNLFSFSIYADLLEEISVEEIVIIVLDECRKATLRLSDFIIYNLVMHIALAIKRINKGFFLDISAPINICEHSLEYETALKIIARIESNLSFVFPPSEANFIAIHLMSKNNAKNIFQKTSFCEQEMREQLLETLSEIEQKTGFTLAQDTILIDGLMLHFIPLLLRLQNSTSVDNPLLKEIRSQYADLFLLTVSYFSKMPIFQKYEMTDNEWAYITIHIAAAVERFLNVQKPRVLIICATGLGSSQMIKNRLEREFGSKIEIKNVISYWEINEQDLTQIDLIISSINIGNIILNVPVVNVSVLLSAEDIAKVNREILNFTGQIHSNKRAKPSWELQKKRLQLIKQYFLKELFFFLEQKSTKETVLKMCIEKIEQFEEQNLAKIFAKQLKLRESYSTVAFTPYLAVPHPVEAVTNNAYVAIVLAPKGIYWEKKHQDIKIVFLLSPDKFGKFEMKLISHMIAEFFEDNTMPEDLLNCATFEKFIEIFSKKFEAINF